MAEDTGKRTLASKTVWAGIIGVAAGVAGFIGGNEFVQDYPTLVSIFVAVQGALAIVLRLITTQPIK